MLQKKTAKVPQKRVPNKANYELNNLKFLGDFMSAKGITTTEAGEKVGKSQVSIYYWLKHDDARLSAVEELINAYGFSLYIDFVDDRKSDNRDDIIITMDYEKRLSFLSVALNSVNKDELAAFLDISPSTIYYWLYHDDIQISYIYKIAEFLGRKVKILIRPVNSSR